MDLPEEEGNPSFWEYVLDSTFFNHHSLSFDFFSPNLPSGGCSTNFNFSSTGGNIANSGGGGGDGGSSCVVINQENECARKRGRDDACSRRATKTYREKLRREQLNDRFVDLSSVLEPGRPVRTDKPAILDDAIRLVNHLRNESHELKEINEKLHEEIRSLKAEKNELHEENRVLQGDNERMEQQLKAMVSSPPGFMQAHPASYHAGPNKMTVYPGYSVIPMWQYLPPSAYETSHDCELRPPAA